MRSERLVLEPVIEAPGQARQSLRDWLVRDGFSSIEEDVLLVASELVANAVLHAGTDLELSYQAGEKHLEVAVFDGNTGKIDAHVVAGALSRCGRGLFMVAAVADEWGVSAWPQGKTVWARWAVTGTKRLGG